MTDFAEIVSFHHNEILGDCGYRG